MRKTKIEKIEENFPELAALAVQYAFIHARKSGRRIVFNDSSKAEIIELLPNGESRVIKKIAPPLQIAVGTVVRIP